LEEKYMLKSHFDIVRSLHLSNDDKILVTVSEDCMVKLWQMPEMEQKHSETRGNIEPYLTLRGHTGSLLAASGRGNVLFTAGVEGVIKMWSLPTVAEVNQYGDTFEGKNYCLATWSNEN
jgi:striatin 1/3/4